MELISYHIISVTSLLVTVSG